AAAGDDDVRGDEAVVADARVMAHVVAAPEDHVAADPDERLDHVRLEDEAVVAEVELAEVDRPRADVADQLVAVPLALLVERAPRTVDAAEADRDEHRALRGRM